MGGAEVGSQSLKEKDFCEPIMRQKGEGGLIFLVHSVMTINSAVITARHSGLCNSTHMHTHKHKCTHNTQIITETHIFVMAASQTNIGIDTFNKLLITKRWRGVTVINKELNRG